MHNYSQILKISILAIIFTAYIPFSTVPRAHADAYTDCISKGTVVGAAVAVVTDMIIAQVTSAISTAMGKEATQSATNVPTQNVQTAGAIGNVGGQTAANNLWQGIIKPFFDQFWYVTAQCTLEFFTDRTITWIQGGFHDSPAFAIRPKQVFLDLQDSVANDLSKQTIGATVDFVPGFKSSLGAAIQLSTRVNARGKFDAALKTTLPVGVNPAAFYRDFSKGGWPAFEASLSDNNNPFGVMLITNRELGTRQSESENIQQQQLSWANGFVDLVDLDQCDYGDAYELDENGQPDPSVYSAEEIATIQKANCSITTPGNIISDQLSRTLGTDIDRLGFADDLNKIITVFMSQLVQKTVNHVF